MLPALVTFVEPVIRVLLTHPYFWPHVTRGAEREIHDAGVRLVERGYRVSLLTGQPTGVTSATTMDGIAVRYVRTPLPTSLARRGWRREGVFGAIAGVGAAVSGADIVTSYLYADAFGATLSKRLPIPRRRRRPVVLKLTGAVPRWWVDGNRVERGLLQRALDAVDEIWVNSRYVVEAMSDWGHPMRVVPAGIDEEAFRPTDERSTSPVVLCTAAPDEPRKRLADLLDAWPSICDALPAARLVIAQSVPDETRSRMLERVPARDRASVLFVGRLDDKQLARAYSQAWTTIAPAVHEALGLATLESLACGTPVVGADSGATPELLDQPGTGALYSPGDADALASAVVEAVALAQADGARERCRAAALRYAWPAIIDEYERRYTALLNA